MNIINSIITGIVSGVIASGLWAFIFFPIHLRGRNKCMFEHIPGTYTQEPKFDYSKKPHQYPDVVIEKVDGRSFKISAKASPPEHWEGMFIMDDVTGNSGRGFYDHDKSGRQLWGNIEILIKDKSSLLTHRSFADKDQRFITQGFILKKKH